MSSRRQHFDGAPERLDSVADRKRFDFFWIASTYQADIAAAALTEATNLIRSWIWRCRTRLGSQLPECALPLTCIAGDGKRPFRLVRPRPLAPTHDQHEVDQPSRGRTAYRIRFVLCGYKIYRTDRAGVRGVTCTAS